MTKQLRAPILMTLVIAMALAGAYLIVAAHPSTVPGGLPPSGVLH